MVSFESPLLGPFRSFTVWPAISPAGKETTSNGGTEFFLSSTLGDGSETGNSAPTGEPHRRVGDHQHPSIDSATPGLAAQQQADPRPTLHAAAGGDAEGRSDTAARLPERHQRPVRHRGNLGCWALFLDPPSPAHVGGAPSSTRATPG